MTRMQNSRNLLNLDLDRSITNQSVKIWTELKTLGSFSNDDETASEFEKNSAMCSCESTFSSSLAPGNNAKVHSKTNKSQPKFGQESESMLEIIDSPDSFYSCTSSITDDESTPSDEWPPVPLIHIKKSSSADSSSSNSLLSMSPYSSNSDLSCDLHSAKLSISSGFSSGCELFDTTLLDAVENTHTQAQMIRKDRLFIVPSRVQWYLQGIEGIRDELGARVSFVRECTDKNCALTLGSQCVRCDNELCVHMYKCSCVEKVGRTGWCSHIHAATLRGRVRFGAEVVVYVHTSAKQMQLRHLRALCYKLQVPKNELLDYQQTVKQFEGQQGESGMRRYRPKPKNFGSSCDCPLFKRCLQCAVCYCSFKCECEEYRILKVTCEHLHIAAMSEKYRSSFRSYLGHLASLRLDKEVPNETKGDQEQTIEKVNRGHELIFEDQWPNVMDRIYEQLKVQDFDENHLNCMRNSSDRNLSLDDIREAVQLYNTETTSTINAKTANLISGMENTSTTAASKYCSFNLASSSSSASSWSDY